MRISILFLICIVFCYCKPEQKIPIPINGTEHLLDEQDAPFYHGVASGDPLSDAVIIWTRVTPTYKGSVDVQWKVAENKTFSSVVKEGSTQIDSSSDYTVKIDVKGLSPDTKYYYRFEALSASSPIGETKTLPQDNADQLALGVVSCSNYEWGYFAAYRHMANKDLDAVLHLGDYFYEYAPGVYGDTTIGRYNVPAREILSLEDYRTRYALYRLDEDLQLAHQKLPFIAIWDDHEITNNAYISGAQNHQDNEGDYQARKEIAKQAYYEWLPIRENTSDVLYRTFEFGNLAEIIMLDERLAGRTKQADSLAQIDDSYTMLGENQLAWFKDKLSTSNKTWKVIGNQVIFSPLDVSKLRPNNPANLDAWDGYPGERDGIINHLVRNNINNTIFLTGDTHTSWAFDVPASLDSYAAQGATAAVEFGTTSITSANWNEGDRTDEEVIQSEKIVLSSNPHLKFINARDHGYLVLRVSPTQAVADYYYVDDISLKDSPEQLFKSIEVQAGTNMIKSQ